MKYWTGMLLSLVVAVVCLVVSITIGARDIDLPTILSAFYQFDNSFDHLVVQTIRLPRSVMAFLVGTCLAVAGALMQGLTRNPLADTGILGIEAGGALAVVLTTFLAKDVSLYVYAGAALVGASLAAVAVYFLGTLGRGGATPLNLTVAGAALTALLSSITTAILILSQRTLEEIRFWLAGSFAGRDFELCLLVLPLIVVGLTIALLLGRQITALSLGEETATSLGQKTGSVKLLTALSVVLLAGSSVAIAGPIGFIGLIIPQVVRLFVKTDYRWIIPFSGIFGAILLIVSDMAARVVLKPQEIPVGIMTSIVGAPFFVYLAKTKVRR